MSAPLRIEAPTDAQLDFVARLCAERGYPPPAVYSKTDASLLIGELLSGDYTPPEWLEDDRAAFANGESMYDPDYAAPADDSVPF